MALLPFKLDFASEQTPLNRKFCSYVRPTGVERRMGAEDIIVSKTDVKGRITYANDVFLQMAGMSEAQALGAPHSIVRHPDMPRAVFKLLWDRLAAGQETFAYVLNFASNGDHYWVFAHVTPSYGRNGQLLGYHSNRRAPERVAIDRIKPIYAQLLAVENNAANARDGMNEAFAALVKTLQDGKTDYDHFVFSLAA